VTSRRLTLVAAATAVVALLASGCGIPTQSGPSAIAANHVPFDLLKPQPPTTTTTQPDPSSLVPVKIFFLTSSQKLQAVERVVMSPAPVTSLLTALLAGPTSAETGSGSTTAIPNDVTVLSAVAQGSVVTVNFNAAFGQITGTSTELAVSQVVATVAVQNGLGTGVSFEIEGQPTSVPISSGAQVPGPVYLLQFLGAAH
jgi:hypothetical protein